MKVLCSSSLSFFLHTILLLLLFTNLNLLNTISSLTPKQCHQDQRRALLEVKNEFKIQTPEEFLDFEGYPINVTCYPKTKSWRNISNDCCNLEANTSLLKLQHLQNLNLAYNNFLFSPIEAKFSNLVGLKSLNLSETCLKGHIPIDILKLTNLVSLGLSSSFSFSPGLLSIENPTLFLSLLSRNLRNLRVLDMSFVNISSEIPLEFSYMWSLRSLSLQGCNLFGEFPSSVLLIPNIQSIRLDYNPNLRGNLPSFRVNNSMETISLIETSFSGILPNSISNLKHLAFLTLQQSYFSGRIPSSLGNLSSLSRLQLSSNHFTGEIPSSVGNLKQLVVFNVGYNNLSGNFPSALLNLTKLRYLSLSYNQFTGFLPRNISQLSKLEGFSAGENFFEGAIPASLFNISSLTSIDLPGNQLNDLPGIENISLLPNLQYFFIYRNNYKVIKPVDFNVFSSLKQLVGVALSGIPLSTTNITPYAGFSSHLRVMYLSGCNITEFPEFIRGKRKLESIDFSNNKIKGKVPDWLWRLEKLRDVDLSKNSLTGFKGSLNVLPESRVEMFDLSSNAFQGQLFIPSTVIAYLFVSSNNFTGEIPRSICGLTSPTIIDLSNNNFHGSIPRCLMTPMSSLSDLNLRNNSLSGSLPDIFMHTNKLRSIDVSHNRFEGKLPLSLAGCSALEVLNVEGNGFNDMFPFWLNSLEKLQVLVLRSDKFHGFLHHSERGWFGFPQLKIIDASHNDFLGTLPSDYFTNWTAVSLKKENYTQPNYIGDFHDYGYYTSVVINNKGVSMEMERILTVYTAIDLSGNRIHGQVPESIGLLKELHVLNLSRNAFTGHIPSSLSNITSLESLDISQNKISGEIPPKLGDISSLGWINVSHNQLVGSIPQGTQFQRQPCSSYEGNPGLRGSSLKDICGDIHAKTSPQSKDEDDEEEEVEIFSWIAAVIGFAPGIIFGLSIGYIVASYKKNVWFIKSIIGRNKNSIAHISHSPKNYCYVP